MKLPVVTIGNLQVSRLIVGGNPFSAISHQSAERDREMRDYYTTERIKQTLRQCEDVGINTFCGRADNHIMRVLNEYWNEGGTIQWLAQTAPERRSIEQNIQQAARAGAKAIYIQGGTVDQAMEDGCLEGLREPLELIHSLGCVSGIAGHNPESHLEAQEMGLPADLYMVCSYNLTGRRGRSTWPTPTRSSTRMIRPRRWPAFRSCRSRASRIRYLPLVGGTHERPLPTLSVASRIPTPSWWACFRRTSPHR